jgi:TPR repeat protein
MDLKNKLILIAVSITIFGCATTTTRNLSSSTPSSIYNQAVALYEKGNYDDAIEKYKASAERGNVSAQWDLGVIYQNGRGVDIDYKEALKWFTKAAKNGDKYSQFNLGYMHYSGQGTPINKAKSFKWYSLAANQGYIDAMYNVAIAYFNGDGVTQNFNEAYRYYKLSAKKGQKDAQFQLAQMYSSGFGVKKNYITAVKWYEKAALQGHSTATYNLGVRYANGEGVPKDYRYSYALFLLSGIDGSLSKFKNNLNESQLEISNTLYEGCKSERIDCLLLKGSKIDSEYLKTEFRKYYSMPPFLQFEKAALTHSLNKYELKQFNCKKKFFGGYKCKRDKKHYDGAEQRMEMTLDSDASLDSLTADIFLPDKLNKKFNSLPGVTASQVYSLMASEWNKKSSNGEYGASKKGIKYKLDL